MAAAMGTPIHPHPDLPAPEGNGTGGGDGDQQAPPKPAAPPGAKTVATHTLAIGIINPPPDIRVVIKKTAAFVAKNGPELERRLLSLNQGDAKFIFLQPSDPYHAYYQHRVSEIAAAPPGADASSLLGRRD